MPDHGLTHVALPVSDLDRSAAFYSKFAAMQIGHPAVPISFAYSVRSQTGDLIKHILDTSAAPVLVMSAIASAVRLVTVPSVAP